MSGIDLKWPTCYVEPWRGIAHFDDVTVEADPICSARPDLVLPCVEDEQVFFCRMLRRICQGESTDKMAIDLGTGSGIFAIYAASMGMRITGVDLNPRALRFARYNLRRHPRAFQERVHLLQGDYLDADSMRAFHASFDYALLNPPFGIPIGSRSLPVAIDGGSMGQEGFAMAVDAAHPLLKENGKLLAIHLLLVDSSGLPLDLRLPAEKWQRLRLYPAYERPIALDEFVREVGGGWAGDQFGGALNPAKYLSMVFLELHKGSNAEAAVPVEVVTTTRLAENGTGWTWAERSNLHRAAAQSSPAKLNASPIRRKFQALSFFLQRTHGDVPSSARSGKEELTAAQQRIDGWILANGLMEPREEFSCVMVEYVPWHLAKNRLSLKAEAVLWSSRADARLRDALQGLQEAIKKIHSEDRSVFRHSGLVAGETQFWQNVSDLVEEYDLEAETAELQVSERLAGRNENTLNAAGHVRSLADFDVRYANQAPADSYDRHLSSVTKDFTRVMLASKCIFAKGCFYYVSVPMPLARPTLEEGGTGSVYVYAWANEPWLLRRETLVADLARFAYFVYEDLSARETRQELRRRQEASARAAVFARNFSHVVGSHVVSNPNFREALVGSSISRFGALLEQSQERMARVREGYLELVGDEGPWPSLNKAGAILRQVDKELGAGGALTGSTRNFHEFLQGRFDFIARAIDETRDQPEPVFFLADLLGGFLKQSAFLDTFVADLGLRLPDIAVIVRLPDPGDLGRCADFRVVWHQESGVWNYQWDSNPTAYDLLIGLPGGMVSAHAFYSLLENVIRNSVKYGVRRSRPSGDLEQYELRLELHSCAQGQIPTWQMRVTDNFSPENLSAARSRIRDLLRPDFILPDGTPRREALGLLEMQACATALYVAPRVKEGSVTEPNLDEIGQGTQPLAYGLRLNKPLLLAVVSGGTKPSWIGQSDYVRFFSSWEEVESLGRGAHLVVADYSAKGLCDELRTRSRLRFTLPYRLLILTETPPAGDDVQAVPRSDRRVQMGHDANLYSRLFGSNRDVTEGTACGLTQVERDILDCYAAWLREWKRHELADEDGWHLWLGFERSLEEVREAWTEPLKHLRAWQGAEKPLVHVKARALQRGETDGSLRTVSTEGHTADSGDSEEAYWEKELAAPRCRTGTSQSKKCLVFDNHGQCFPHLQSVEKSDDFRKSTRFYQRLSGSETPDLFRLLSHPPSSPFAFTFFIYSLVESCLADVAIVDERLAADLLFPSSGSTAANPAFRRDLGEHQKAGAFPVFGVRRGSSTAERYTPRHQAAFAHEVSRAADEGEGVTLSNVSASLGLLAYDEETGGFRVVCDIDGEIRCDVLVIHEGVLDLIGLAVDWPSAPETNVTNEAKLDELMSKLLALSPALIRMSGRGRHTKHFPPGVPFIEFSEVSSSLLTARNKFALVRGLFGAAGTSGAPDQ